MDVETTLLVVSALFGIVGGSVACLVGVLHIYGWLPKRYTDRLEAVQRGVAVDVGVEVEKALVRVSERERDLLEASAKEAEAAYAAQAKSAEMSMVRAVGVDKQLHARVDRLIADAVLGPAMPLLRQFAPGLADALDENPQLIDVVIRNPLFIKYVQPRIEQFLGGMATNAEPSPGAGWGP